MISANTKMTSMSLVPDKITNRGRRSSWHRTGARPAYRRRTASLWCRGPGRLPGSGQGQGCPPVVVHRTACYSTLTIFFLNLWLWDVQLWNLWSWDLLFLLWNVFWWLWFRGCDTDFLIMIWPVLWETKRKQKEKRKTCCRAQNHLVRALLGWGALVPVGKWYRSQVQPGLMVRDKRPLLVPGQWTGTKGDLLVQVGIINRD
jgi:hypothetical protein